ncbi:hypothetical protein VCCP1050_2907, partial [Vibrio cholerae CP1050(23)]
MRLRLNISAQ